MYVSPALSLSPWANISKEAWFLEAFDSSENIHFFNPALYDYFVQDKAYSWIVPMSRYVQINEGSRVTEGVLLISIKYSAFAAVFGNSAFDRGKYSFLMDSGGMRRLARALRRFRQRSFRLIRMALIRWK